MLGPSPPRTYFVEDSPTLRENLIATLEELGGPTSVGFAETEQEASQWLTEHAAQWDLAIVDVFLKRGSGLGVLQACRARGPGQKLVVFTSYATPAMRRRCQELGVDAVFDKSIEVDGLIDFCLELARGTQ